MFEQTHDSFFQKRKNGVTHYELGIPQNNSDLNEIFESYVDNP